LSDLKDSVVAFLRKYGLDGLATRLDSVGSELRALALVRDARNAIVTGKTKSGQEIRFVRKQPDDGVGLSRSEGEADLPDQAKARVLQGSPAVTLTGDEAPRTGMAAVRSWATELFERQGGK